MDKRQIWKYSHKRKKTICRYNQKSEIWRQHSITPWTDGYNCPEISGSSDSIQSAICAYLRLFDFFDLQLGLYRTSEKFDHIDTIINASINLWFRVGISSNATLVSLILDILINNLFIFVFYYPNFIISIYSRQSRFTTGVVLISTS